MHSNSASQSSSSIALHSPVFSRLLSPSLNSVSPDVNFLLVQSSILFMHFCLQKAEFFLVLYIIAQVILHCILKHKFRSSASLWFCATAAPAIHDWMQSISSVLLLSQQGEDVVCKLTVFVLWSLLYSRNRCEELNCCSFNRKNICKRSMNYSYA